MLSHLHSGGMRKWAPNEKGTPRDYPTRYMRASGALSSASGSRLARVVNLTLDKIFGILDFPSYMDKAANVGTSFEGKLRLESGHDHGTILNIHIKELGHKNQGNLPASSCCQPGR